MTHDEIMQTLREACDEQKVCRLHLKGEPDNRLIHPYGVCFSKKDKLLIVAVLSEGYSQSKGPGYRNFFYENCDEVEKLNDGFLVDPGFNPFSDQYSGWLFHVLKKNS